MGNSRRRDAVPLVIAALLLLESRPADPLPGARRGPGAWAGDLRELLPDLERLATASPDDIEGEAGASWGGAGVRLPTDRFHAARKVAALWREEDAATRARLLLVFGRFEPILSMPEGRARFEQSLADAAASLPGGTRHRLLRFLEKVETSGVGNAGVARLTRRAPGWLAP